MCANCGCRSLAIIGRFSAEHELILDAMGDARRAATAGDDLGAHATSLQLTALLDPHVASEERSLFTEMRADPEFTDHIALLCAEHEEISARLARFTAGDHRAADDLESLLRSHVDKEENGRPVPGSRNNPRRCRLGPRHRTKLTDNPQPLEATALSLAAAKRF
jgi:Hemerythrin HHE cation binding domain